MIATQPKETILIVDDTPANLHFLDELLTKKGYRTRLAPNGGRALSSIRAAVPDLVLLDIMMPGMDGYEVCQTLKADELAQDIPVIFISALDEVFDKMKAFSSGGVDYITKPFQPEEVLARIETHLDLRRLRLSLQEKNQALKTANNTLEEKVEARTIALKTEIEQRKSHQQEKDRLFELAQQQSDQLRSLTNLLIKAQQNQRQGLSTGLEQELQPKIDLLRTHLNTLQAMFPPDHDSQMVVTMAATIRLLAEMESYINQVTANLDQAAVAEQEMSSNPLLQLSAREREVLRLVSEGKSNAEVAEILSVSVNTVYTYLKRIRQKLNLQHVSSLAIFAQEHGFWVSLSQEFPQSIFPDGYKYLSVTQ